MMQGVRECGSKSAEVRWLGGLVSIRPPPYPPTMAFCLRGAGWCFCLLSSLDVLTRGPSGCFHCVSRCSLTPAADYLLTQQYPFLSTGGAPRRTHGHTETGETLSAWEAVFRLSCCVDCIRGSGSAQGHLRRSGCDVPGPSTMAPDSPRRDTDAG